MVINWRRVGEWSVLVFLFQWVFQRYGHLYGIAGDLIFIFLLFLSLYGKRIEILLLAFFFGLLKDFFFKGIPGTTPFAYTLVIYLSGLYSRPSFLKEKMWGRVCFLLISNLLFIIIFSFSLGSFSFGKLLIFSLYNTILSLFFFPLFSSVIKKD